MKNQSAYPAAIFARMTSSRLPGKPLLDLCGRPMISYVIDALRNCSGVAEVVLATSSDESDDPLCEYAIRHNLRCIRGSLRNVASRLCDTIRALETSAVYRVNGDSPLVSCELLSKAASTFMAESYDILTNVYPRTFPPGMSVELINCMSYLDAYPKMKSRSELEHVTQHFYRNADRYRIFNLSANEDYSMHHLCIDTPQDLRRLEQIVRLMTKATWKYSVDEVIEVLKSVN